MNLKGKRRTLFLLLAVVVLAGGYWLWQVLNAPVPQYQTLIVRPGELQQNVLATGKLDALRKVDVGAQVSGQLKTLSVEIGDKVKKGREPDPRGGSHADGAARAACAGAGRA